MAILKEALVRASDAVPEEEEVRYNSRVLITHHDPYLAFLIRRQVPEAEVIEAEGEDLAKALRCDPDLVIVLGPAEHEALQSVKRIVHVIDQDMRERVKADAPVLYRPLLPTEVERVVRTALGSKREPSRKDMLMRARQLMGPARVLAVLLSVFLDTRTGDPTAFTERLIAGAFAYTTFRALRQFGGRTGAILDTVAAAGFVAVSGGPASDLAPLAFVLVVAGAIEIRSWHGIWVGAFVSLAALSDFVVNGTPQHLRTAEVTTWVALFCLGGLAAGLSAGVTRSREGLQMLSEANRVLSTLYRFARMMPGALDQGSIASSAMTELSDRLGSPSGVLIVNEVGTPVIAGSFGCPAPEKLLGKRETMRLRAIADQGARVVGASELPSAVVEALGGHRCFLIAPAARDGITLGILLSSCVRHPAHDRNLIFLRELAEEAGIALENARLFARLRIISADEERMRLGRELHDGLIQALTHVRIELDLLARRTPAKEPQDEIKRLSRLVQTAAIDVRQMIFGLRSPVGERGLAGALRAFLNDIRSPRGPEVSFFSAGEVRPDSEIEGEAFRIAQEAVSNALKHARATHVRVVLCVADDGLELVVEDDGIGFHGSAESSGVGLTTMKERAARVAGELTVVKGVSGGTRVTLTCPVHIEEVV